MITPNRFRSCHPHSGIPKATAAQLGRSERDTRTTAIFDLERAINVLEIPELGYSTVSDHATAQVLNLSTLAVVVLCRHNAQIIEQAILAQKRGDLHVSTDGDIITVAI